MPYIRKEEREKIDNALMYLGRAINDVGTLNYAITKLSLSLLNKLGTSYKSFNSLIGVLECAKMELYRRMISRYEDKKIEENGDVYDE